VIICKVLEKNVTIYRRGMFSPSQIRWGSLEGRHPGGKNSFVNVIRVTPSEGEIGSVLTRRPSDGGPVVTAGEVGKNRSYPARGGTVLSEARRGEKKGKSINTIQVWPPWKKLDFRESDG